MALTKGLEGLGDTDFLTVYDELDGQVHGLGALGPGVAAFTGILKGLGLTTVAWRPYVEELRNGVWTRTWTGAYNFTSSEDAIKFVKQAFGEPPSAALKNDKAAYRIAAEQMPTTATAETKADAVVEERKSAYQEAPPQSQSTIPAVITPAPPPATEIAPPTPPPAPPTEPSQPDLNVTASGALPFGLDIPVYGPVTRGHVVAVLAVGGILTALAVALKR